ncbi:hypothetical protein M9H77_16991 [Catharanthus roseus]|uniref:Uncharacterized protein n=1 Tax=Catharanthus roseus TaxID=4058 RepID=A0ACC0B3D4_CATRO|nr:hypothetical protein M9H77_16991 [Catharanthus roseus]
MAPTKEKWSSVDDEQKEITNNHAQGQMMMVVLGIISDANKEVSVELFYKLNLYSENGETCHQCRQKRKDFASECQNIRKDKPSPIRREKQLKSRICNPGIVPSVEAFVTAAST